MNKNRMIAYIGLGIALYAVLSAFVNIPIVNRIRLDLGYIVFGIYLEHFGLMATIVGVAGCIIGNLLKGGSFAFAWAIGQAFIGISLGLLLPRTKNKILSCLYAMIAVFIGIALIKTVIEVWLFKLPLYAKFLSNCAAFAADAVGLLIGILLADKVRIERR